MIKSTEAMAPANLIMKRVKDKGSNIRLAIFFCNTYYEQKKSDNNTNGQRNFGRENKACGSNDNDGKKTSGFKRIKFHIYSCPLK